MYCYKDSLHAKIQQPHVFAHAKYIMFFKQTVAGFQIGVDKDFFLGGGLWSILTIYFFFNDDYL